MLNRRIINRFLSYAYDEVGSLATVTQPNGVASTYAYDSLNRLTNLTTSKGGATVAGYTYQLGPAGNRLAVTEARGRTVNYSYDALYRLTGETMAADLTIANNGTINYSYDAVGNRLARRSTVAAIPAAESEYDSNDRLTTDTYDANGNTKQSQGSAYAYEFEHRLTSVNHGAVAYLRRY